MVFGCLRRCFIRLILLISCFCFTSIYSFKTVKRWYSEHVIGCLHLEPAILRRGCGAVFQQEICPLLGIGQRAELDGEQSCTVVRADVNDGDGAVLRHAGNAGLHKRAGCKDSRKRCRTTNQFWIFGRTPHGMARRVRQYR